MLYSAVKDAEHVERAKSNVTKLVLSVRDAFVRILRARGILRRRLSYLKILKSKKIRLLAPLSPLKNLEKSQTRRIVENYHTPNRRSILLFW